MGALHRPSPRCGLGRTSPLRPDARVNKGHLHGSRVGNELCGDQRLVDEECGAPVVGWWSLKEWQSTGDNPLQR